jgi:transcriptional regulator GlxA family with amidase domain
MQAAFLLYPGFTALDAIGPFQVLASAPGVDPVFVAKQPGPIASDTPACSLMAQRSLVETQRPEIVVVPGSLSGFQGVMEDTETLDWLRATSAHATYVTSVCTGSLLLAAAGLLDGRAATTHWAARELLVELGATVATERVVDLGQIITSTGVSSGIDMALHLVRRIEGDDVARAVQLGIEYDPQPLFGTGAIERCPPALVATVRTALHDRGARWISTPASNNYQ